MPLSALFRLAFATATGVTPLTSRHVITRRFILQEARRHAVLANTALRLLVSIRFQDLLTPVQPVLFTFPSRYLFTIGHEEYLVLRSGLREFPQD